MRKITSILGRRTMNARLYFAVDFTNARLHGDNPHGQGLPIPNCTELAKEIYAEPNGEDIDEAITTLIQETDLAHLLPSTVEHTLFKKRFVERIKYHSQIFLAKGHIERIKEQLKRTTAFQAVWEI
jgi:hypothetical protein